MKLAVIDSVFGGTDQNREKTIEHLDLWMKNGLKVNIFTSPDGFIFYQKIFGKSVTIGVLPFASKLNKNLRRSIAFEYVKRCIGTLFFRPNCSFDAAYSITSHLSDILVLSKFAKLGIRTYANFDNFVPPPNIRPGNYFWNLLAFGAFKITLSKIKNIDCIFAYLIEDNYARLCTYLKSSNVLVERFDNGLDIDLIRSAEKLLITYDLLYLGRMHQAKGIFDFIGLVQMLLAKKANLKVAIAGSGDLKTLRTVTDQIKKSGLENVISTFGFVGTSKKYSLMRSSRFFIAPTYDDSYPVSIIEAYVSGCSIISYDLPIYKAKPFCDFNIAISKMGDINGLYYLTMSRLRSENDYENLNFEAIPTYKKNAEKEMGLFLSNL